MSDIKETQQELSELLQIRRDKLSDLQASGKDPFQITKYHVTAHAAEIISSFEQFEGTTVSLAGRMMSKRSMGKASFIDISDQSGRVQCYVRLDGVGEETYFYPLFYMKKAVL